MKSSGISKFFSRQFQRTSKMALSMKRFFIAFVNHHNDDQQINAATRTGFRRRFSAQGVWQYSRAGNDAGALDGRAEAAICAHAVAGADEPLCRATSACKPRNHQP